MSTTIESTLVPYAKDIIEWWLAIYTEVRVVGSRTTEDGYELVFEGSDEDVSQLIWILGNGKGMEPSPYLIGGGR